MNRSLKARVAQMEAASPDEAWRAWLALDPEELTDEMLEVILRAELRTEGIEPPETFSDEYLQAIIEGKEPRP